MINAHSAVLSARPRVSVVTGYYNRVEHLEVTVRSILDQTFKDLELIVFDDASTDGTDIRLRQLIEEFKDERLRVIIHRENKGFTQGMIDAVDQASGEFIAIQGSGDFSLPERIAEQVKFLDENPDVGVVGCWYTNVVAITGLRRPRQPDARAATAETLARENVFSHGEVMIRRTAYVAAGGYRAAFKNCQDVDLWFRVLRHAKLGTVKKYLYDRYVRMDGVSYEPKKFAIQARYSMLARKLDALPAHDSENLLRRLEQEGPEALVSYNDPELQKRYFKAATRALVWGAFTEAELLARTSINSPIKRILIVSATRFFRSFVGKAILALMRRGFGVG